MNPGGNGTTGGRGWAPWVVALLVLAGQWWLVAAAGTDIPFQDQWDAEGRDLYPRWIDGSLPASHWLAAHNEHRIAFTRATDAALFALNGRQWDPLVQLAVNAVLHAAGAGLLAWLLVRGRSRAATWTLAAAATVALQPVAGWHNALWGFQSQVYFALLWGLLALGLLTGETAGGGRRAAGWIAALAAGISMAPGLLVLAVVPVLFAARAVERRKFSPAEFAVPLLLLAAAAWLWPVAPEHATLRATAAQFIAAWMRLLAWPHVDQPLAAFALNLPVFLLVLRRLTGRRPAVAGEDGVLAVALWAGAIAAAAAWGRGGGDEFAAGVPSRYADFVVLLPLANLWSVVVLAGAVPAERRKAVGLCTGAWGLFLLVGWAGLAGSMLRGVILPRARDVAAPVRLVREFQATGDAAVFAGQPRLLVPHPNPEAVRAVLHDPRMQGALPPSLRPERPMGPLSRAVRRGLGR